MSCEKIDFSVDIKKHPSGIIVGIISGYFNPLHIGHIEYIKEAKRYCHWLVVIINNDQQAINKVGYVYMNEKDRQEIIMSLRDVNSSIISIDTDDSVVETLKCIAEKMTNCKIRFLNSGDRDYENRNLAEDRICKELDIEQVFIHLPKKDSSTRLRSTK